MLGTEVINTPQMPSCLWRLAKRTRDGAAGERAAIRAFRFYHSGCGHCFFLTWFILQRTTIGRSIVAVGNSQEACKARRLQPAENTPVYLYTGRRICRGGRRDLCFRGSVGIPLTNNLVGGTELPTIAAVVIGGAKLSGGEGSVFGAVLGVLLIRLFHTTLIFLGLDLVESAVYRNRTAWVYYRYIAAHAPHTQEAAAFDE